jgi:hypothetical protein
VHARERMIRTRFTEHECADCGSHYLPTSVVVLARRRSAWMVMASCPNCDRRALFVVTFPEQAAPNAVPLTFEEPRVFPRAFLPLPADFASSTDVPTDLPLAPPPPAQPAPVSERDVAAMHDFLASFDGDFGALFGPHKRNRLDD